MTLRKAMERSLPTPFLAFSGIWDYGFPSMQLDRDYQGDGPPGPDSQGHEDAHGLHLCQRH